MTQSPITMLGVYTVNSKNYSIMEIHITEHDAETGLFVVEWFQHDAGCMLSEDWEPQHLEALLASGLLTRKET